MIIMVVMMMVMTMMMLLPLMMIRMMRMATRAGQMHGSSLHSASYNIVSPPQWWRVPMESILPCLEPREATVILSHSHSSQHLAD